MSHKHGSENSSIKCKKWGQTAIPNAVMLTGARMVAQEFLELLKSPVLKDPQRRP